MHACMHVFVFIFVFVLFAWMHANKQIQINTYSEMKKMNAKYKKEIYFENKDLILNIPNKNNIKVFLNGVLISYNNYDLIEYLDNYAYGIKLNNNIF